MKKLELAPSYSKKTLSQFQNFPILFLQNLYKYTKALVFPSFIEGFGWPPLRLQRWGCPVITTRTGAIFDLLGNYAKYVETENQESIDQGVLQKHYNYLYQRELLKLPSHQDCQKKYLDLYEQNF